MRITVDIKGMAALQARLAGLQKQVNFAASRALNATAKAVDAEERSAMRKVFDRPRQTTVNATYIKYSNKTNLEAAVGLKERGAGVPAAEYLHPNIGASGRQPRNYKRSEFMLKRAGILPEGLFTVPGKEAKLDEYGNMSRGQINQILSFFRTFGMTALNSKRMNMTEKRRAQLDRQRRQYFVVPVADRKVKLYPGIWQETHDRTLAPVLMFVSRPAYRAIYDFGGLAEKVVRRTFGKEFDAALADALRTAR